MARTVKRRVSDPGAVLRLDLVPDSREGGRGDSPRAGLRIARGE